MTIAALLLAAQRGSDPSICQWETLTVAVTCSRYYSAVRRNEWLAVPSRTLHWEQEAGPGGVPALILFSWTSRPDWLDLWQQKSKQWLPQGKGCWPEEAWGNFLGGENVLWWDKTQVTRVYSLVSSDEAELVRSAHSAGVEPEARSSRQGGVGLAWIQSPVHPCLLA